MSESDLRTLREAIENGDISKAIEFWRCWPMILETLVATGMDPETAKHDTAEVYRVATGLLIGEAEKRGEDPKPIRLSVQAFHKIVLANRPFRDRDACSTITWPECLGAIEESLSGVLKDALDESVYLLDRLSKPALQSPEKPKPTIEERFRAKFLEASVKDFESAISKTARAWALELDCSAGSVKGSQTWETIKTLREAHRPDAVNPYSVN